MADPWFNLRWFIYNKYSIDKMLNFWGKVIWWLNPENARIKVLKEDNKIKVWTIYQSGPLKGKYELAHEFKLFKNDRINVGKTRALKRPLVWAIAIKMKYIKFPRTWKPLTKWKKTEWMQGRLEKRIDDGKVALAVIDKHGRHVKIPLEYFTPDMMEKIWQTLINKGEIDFETYRKLKEKWKYNEN